MKILRYSILGGLFLTPLIPLVVSGSLFFPFITGKNFSFRILVEILLGLWLILALYDKRYRPRKSWILIFLSAFVLVLALSSIFGENFYRSFWSNYERMEGLITHLHLFAYFLVLASVLASEKLWSRFFHASLGVSAVMGIYGLFQLGGAAAIHQGSTRLDASLGNSSYLAIYMVFNIFIALFYFAKGRERYRMLYLPLIALQTAVLYYTATRGAILGFVGGLFLAALTAALISKNKRVKIVSAALLLAVVLSVAGVWFARDTSFVKDSHVLSRFTSISMKDGTTQSRFVIWGMAWKGFKEKPILGWGPENFNLIFNKYYEPILWKQEPWFDRAHNVFFDRLTTNGILGLLAYLGLFLSALYYLLFRRRESGFSVSDSAILTGLLGAYFFHNLFVFDNIVSFLLFFAVLAYVHFRAVGAAEEEGDSLVSAPGGGRSALTALIIVAIPLMVYNLNVPGLLASRALLGAYRETAVGNVPGAFAEFERAISYGSFGTTEAREHLINFANRVVRQPNMDEGFKNKVFSFAVSEMKKQIASAPNDIRYMIFLGSLYNNAGQYDSAIAVLNRAIELAPRKQSLYFELGNSYINKGEYEKAAEVLKTSFELEPGYDIARKIYALSLVYARDYDLAEKILKDRYGTGTIADRRFVNAYAEGKKFDKAVEVWEKIIKKEPDNPQIRVNAAATYMKLGEKRKAIEQIEKAMELDPNFKKQGEYYISEINAGRNP